jgi:hypothetical protein
MQKIKSFGQRIERFIILGGCLFWIFNKNISVGGQIFFLIIFFLVCWSYYQIDELKRIKEQ